MKNRISKTDIANMDKILGLMFNKNSKYEHIEDTKKYNFDPKEISITREELKNEFDFSDEQISKYLQLFFCRNTLESKFIDINKGQYWIMDKGIEFYYSGGFGFESKKKRQTKLIINITAITSIITIIGIIFTILYGSLAFRDKSELDKRITTIEEKLNK